MSNESTPGITLTISEGAIASIMSAFTAHEEKVATERRNEYERKALCMRQDTEERRARQDAEARGSDALLEHMLAEHEEGKALRTAVLTAVLNILQAYAAKAVAKYGAPSAPQADPDAPSATPDFNDWGDRQATKDEVEE